MAHDLDLDGWVQLYVTISMAQLDHLIAAWTDFVRDAAMSRVSAGVNFTKTAERSVEFGMQFGDMAYEFVHRHVEGDVED
ncbi:hypothetical protein DMB38_25240 [Streptomyces sp. WAC 06738]|uniref:hypothetical protein n=1 Tax=Streptomyces sp. WAC 06738 TaxID=2203210 RepID=UPI000F704E60|nr:hypothetical protein [Streptomyces sp. WAC 06738]AZM48654.1 hypothetical protein DMB38_25240 [Streptomyces sp. WAC 06738]